jgi:hypothetical protein
LLLLYYSFIGSVTSVVIFGVPNICLANSKLNPNISDIITIALSTSVNPDVQLIAVFAIMLVHHQHLLKLLVIPNV